jgi:hypothetical protein
VAFKTGIARASCRLGLRGETGSNGTRPGGIPSRPCRAHLRKASKARVSNRVRYRALAINFTVGVGDDPAGVASRRRSADIAWDRGLGRLVPHLELSRRHAARLADYAEWACAAELGAEVDRCRTMTIGILLVTLTPR